MSEQEFKKWFLKSRTVVVNLLSVLVSFILIFWETIGDLLNENLPYLKSILTPDKMLIAFIFLALFNAYSRIKKSDIVLKKKDCECSKKKKVKDEQSSE